MDAGAESQPCVLVVDDHPDFLEALRLFLERSGFHVLTADNGAEAVAWATEHPPDAIIMDVGMPVLDGIAATAQLKSSPRSASIPVIGFTAHPFDSVKARATDAGMREVLPKSSFRELVDVLRAVVKRKDA
jgi:CheY-like chemotaxis protein